MQPFRPTVDWDEIRGKNEPDEGVKYARIGSLDTELNRNRKASTENPERFDAVECSTCFWAMWDWKQVPEHQCNHERYLMASGFLDAQVYRKLDLLLNDTDFSGTPPKWVTLDKLAKIFCGGKFRVYTRAALNAALARLLRLGVIEEGVVGATRTNSRRTLYRIVEPE